VVVYKASRMINFALGEWVMVASRLAASGHHALGLAGAIGAGCGGMVALGVVVSRIVLRRVAGQSLISLIMVSIGLGTLMRGAASLVFAGIPGGIPLPIPRESLVILHVPVPAGKLIAAVIAVLCIAALTAFFHGTRSGLALRAIACDPQVAAAVGIGLRHHFALTWALAGVLAVVAGMLWTAVVGGGLGVGILGLKVFPIVIIGGLDSVPGTILAAILIGVLESLSVGYLEPVMGGGFGTVMSYVVLIGTLCVRPYGFFGRPDIERV
jgi:branched-chain amino acid transport system permease protein